ncbi:MAG TPA: 16S rRNA (cytosine(1402)-N(4))-methyltransferase RsmH [Tepidisphaeraceae bacterium]|nr:16S rRNA (cytosine(1402)-N(4))-methyltransferase RsmH [Tepidisphaeraceae bacterium]
MPNLPEHGHEPVLMTETLDALDPAPGKTIIDCTLGRAGHALRIAQQLAPDGLLIGLDADPRNLDYARERLSGVPCRTELIHTNFSELAMVLRKLKIDSVDGILADLGVSTNQLFEAEYGMSFQSEMPLDMRLNPRQTLSAAEIVNKTPETELANLLFQLADERFSRRIARKIIEQRRVSPITTTGRLAAIVRSALPVRSGAADRIDPATRTFLALRMAVNRELENLKSLLTQGMTAIKPGGRLVVISFQSSEDRVVKQTFRFAEQTGLCRILTNKPLTPDETEIASNPRSRSSKLRAIQKL